MTDTIDTEQHSEALTGRKLTNALTLLLSDLADAVDARFPSDGNPASQAYVQNYEAHRSAYAAVRAALVGQPPVAEFRAEVLSYVQQAWTLTAGRPEVDELVRKCIDRAADDYRPDTPDELKRSSTPKKAAAVPAPTAKVNGK